MAGKRCNLIGDNFIAMAKLNNIYFGNVTLHLINKKQKTKTDRRRQEPGGA